MHPASDLGKERDFYTLARRLTRGTGRKHVVDHIIPLAAGGFHHHDNLQVLPDSVNAQKRDNPLWISETYRDWRSVPQHLWPFRLFEAFTAKLRELNAPKYDYAAASAAIFCRCQITDADRSAFSAIEKPAVSPTQDR